MDNCICSTHYLMIRYIIGLLRVLTLRRRFLVISSYCNMFMTRLPIFSSASEFRKSLIIISSLISVDSGCMDACLQKVNGYAAAYLLKGPGFNPGSLLFHECSHFLMVLVITLGLRESESESINSSLHEDLWFHLSVCIEHLYLLERHVSSCK